jgi:small ligand-binding sensory domain FIST
MNPIRFAAAHAAHRDWRVALRRALDDMLHDARVATAHAADGGEVPAEYTLGLCYLTDAFADEAEAILAELQHRLPGVHWVGTVGVGVAATGAEHFDQPALALMLAPLPRNAFRVFTGRQPLRADSEDFHPHTALSPPNR